MKPRKAKVVNPECLLYDQTVEIIAAEVVYIDQDNEHYIKGDLEFLD